MRRMEISDVQLLLLDGFIEVDRICKEYDIPYYMIAGSLVGAAVYKGFVPWDDDVDLAMMRKDYEKFLCCCQEELNGKYFLQNYNTDVDFHPPISRICISGTFIDEHYSKHLKFNKGLYLDIFPLDNIPDDEEIQKKQERKIWIIDKLILHKLCMVYDQGPFKWKLGAKKIISGLLLPLPLNFLHKLREEIVREYEEEITISVCSSTDRYDKLKERGVHPREAFGEPILLEFEGYQFYAPERWDAYLQKLYGDYREAPPEHKRIPEHQVYELFDL